MQSRCLGSPSPPTRSWRSTGNPCLRSDVYALDLVEGDLVWQCTVPSCQLVVILHADVMHGSKRHQERRSPPAVDNWLAAARPLAAAAPTRLPTAFMSQQKSRLEVSSFRLALTRAADRRPHRNSRCRRGRNRWCPRTCQPPGTDTPTWPADPDVGLVDAPTPRARPAPLPAQALLHLRRESLHPAIERRVVERDAAFGHHRFEVAVADWVAALPPYRPEHDLTLKMPSLEIVHAPTPRIIQREQFTDHPNFATEPFDVPFLSAHRSSRFDALC